MINKRSCNFINHFQQLIVTEPTFTSNRAVKKSKLKSDRLDFVYFSEIV